MPQRRRGKRPDLKPGQSVIDLNDWTVVWDWKAVPRRTVKGNVLTDLTKVQIVSFKSGCVAANHETILKPRERRFRCSTTAMKASRNSTRAHGISRRTMSFTVPMSSIPQYHDSFSHNQQAMSDDEVFAVDKTDGRHKNFEEQKQQEDAVSNARSVYVCPYNLSLVEDISRIYFGIKCTFAQDSKNVTGPGRSHPERAMSFQVPAGHDSLNHIGARCQLAYCHSHIVQALYTDWSGILPNGHNNFARQPLEILIGVYTILDEGEWLDSWNIFISSLSNGLLASLTKYFGKTYSVLDHLKSHAPGSLLEWSQCHDALEKYCGKLVNEQLRRGRMLSQPVISSTSSDKYRRIPDPIAQKSVTFSSQKTPTPKLYTNLKCSRGEQLDIEDFGPASVRRPETPKVLNSGTFSGTPRPRIEVMYDVNDKQINRGYDDGNEISNLTDDAVILLAGWCRLGQMYTPDIWIKVFCLLFASIVMPAEQPEDFADIDK